MAIEPKKTSELEVAEILTGEELIPIVQGGQNKAAKVKTVNSSNIQELTLSELQSLHINNLTPPTVGLEYLPSDVIGGNLRTWYYRYYILITQDPSGDIVRSTISEEFTFQMYDDPDGHLNIIISGVEEYKNIDGVLPDLSNLHLRIIFGTASNVYDYYLPIFNFEDNYNGTFTSEVASYDALVGSDDSIYPIINNGFNSLPPYQLYNVVDKNWLLFVNENNKLESVSGDLKIMFDETLPKGIEPEYLIIDTGIFPENNSFEISISAINGYILENVYVRDEIGDFVNAGYLFEINQIFPNSNNISLISNNIPYSDRWQKCTIHQASQGSIISELFEGQILISANGDPLDGIRVLLQYKKIPLYPLPNIIFPALSVSYTNKLMFEGTSLDDIYIENLFKNQYNLISLVVKNVEKCLLEINNIPSKGLFTVTNGYKFKIELPENDLSIIKDSVIFYKDDEIVLKMPIPLQGRYGGIMPANIEIPVITDIPIDMDEIIIEDCYIVKVDDLYLSSLRCVFSHSVTNDVMSSKGIAYYRNTDITLKLNGVELVEGVEWERNGFFDNYQYILDILLPIFDVLSENRPLLDTDIITMSISRDCSLQDINVRTRYFGGTRQPIVVKHSSIPLELVSTIYLNGYDAMEFHFSKKINERDLSNLASYLYIRQFNLNEPSNNFDIQNNSVVFESFILSSDKKSFTVSIPSYFEVSTNYRYIFNVEPSYILHSSEGGYIGGSEGIIIPLNISIVDGRVEIISAYIDDGTIYLNFNKTMINSIDLSGLRLFRDSVEFNVVDNITEQNEDDLWSSFMVDYDPFTNSEIIEISFDGDDRFKPMAKTIIHLI